MKNSKRSMKFCDCESLLTMLQWVKSCQKAGEGMDLFDYMRESSQEKESPLASRLRPTTLDEIVGQEHILGKDKLLLFCLGQSFGNTESSVS